MKRKIAILLAAVMTTAMLPMNVMAASTNNINKTATVKDDEIIEGVYLKIVPRDEIASRDSIILTVENAKFDEDEYNKKANEDHDTKDKEYIETYQKGAHTWKSAIDALSGKKLETVINECFQDGDNELPYNITVNSKKEIQVELFPLMSSAADRDWTNARGVNVGKPCYMIPLQVVSDGTGDVKVKVDDNNTSITGGQTHTFATSTSSSGSTTATVDDIETFEDWGYLEDITIKETVKDTFDSGEKVTIRLNSGFLFNENESRSNKDGKKDAFKIKGGSNLTIKGPNGVLTDAKFDEDEITFIMPEFESRSKAGSIVISGLAIEADDEDEDWGDVNLTISGAGLSKQTIKVAERADYGFKMTALEEPTTIIAGRTIDFKHEDLTVGSDDIDDDDCVSAQIKFEETIKNTWITSRKLEFSVPEGVKIIKYEFEDDEYINSKLDSYASITNSGTTLKIDKGIDIDDDDLSLFKLKLYLSADADYEGEVKLSVAGGGLAEGTLSDVVIANVVTPITIETSETKTNMGYQAVDTSDIVITENEPGILIKNENVKIAIDSAYGTDELGFADNDIDYEIDGDLKIKNFKVSKGVISFTIDKESYNEPASITIKNVQVGTTRSVPYGSYDVTVGGSAVINNYFDDNDLYDEGTTDASGAFDTTENYKFANYLTITTNTGTLDEVVKVTKDQKTILINDESKDMDVAPYIQSTTNSMMVPLRFVSLALGVDTNGVDDADNSSRVSWDANSKTATIFYAAGNGQKLIQFTAGSSVMVVDGTSIPMANGAVAEIRDGRMFVPFRALGQALGVPVSWDQDTFTAIYNQK